MMSILLIAIQPDHLTPERRATLDRLSGGLKVIVSSDHEEIAGMIDEVEIAIGEVPRYLLSRAPNLKWHQQMGTGTEWLEDHPDAVNHPFILTNCSDDYGVVLAEHIMALILACARQLPEHFDSQRRGAWEMPVFSDPKRFELRGKTLLLVGTGSIGREIAKRARGFGMRVVGLRSDSSRQAEWVERMYASDQLHAALAEADLVVNSLPITQTTRGFFNCAAFEHMKPSAYFFNIGRGATVDETALINALEENRIAGAGLDVFETEPLPANSPLWRLPNVILTPHSGGNHDRRYDSWVETAFDNLERFATGQPLRNLVNKQRGY